MPLPPKTTEMLVGQIEESIAAIRHVGGELDESKIPAYRRGRIDPRLQKVRETLVAVRDLAVKGARMDDHSLEDGADIKIALRSASLMAKIYQLSPFEDAQPDPIFGTYRVDIEEPIRIVVAGTVAELLPVIARLGTK